MAERGAGAGVVGDRARARGGLRRDRVTPGRSRLAVVAGRLVGGAARGGGPRVRGPGRSAPAAGRARGAAWRARCYSLPEIDASDDRRFRAIVGRLLLRDGWTQVRGVRISREVVHLVGNGPDGRQLGVAFERGADRAGQGNGGRAALRPVGGAPHLPTATAPGARPLFLVVSTGTFARERVVWAARHGVRLVDRALLQRWAAGEDLAVLLDLDLDHAQPDAS